MSGQHSSSITPIDFNYKQNKTKQNNKAISRAVQKLFERANKKNDNIDLLNINSFLRLRLF